MTPRPRLARSAAWLSVLAGSLVACGDDATTTTGGTGGSTTSTGGAESVSVASSSADTGTTTAASSSTGMGTPCTPLKDGVDPNPTPGACEGNVAVTRGQDGFLASESCSGGSSCAEYDLQEWRFDGNSTNPMWVKGRTVHWAG
mgnify:CR=1 FL=1